MAEKTSEIIAGAIVVAVAASFIAYTKKPAGASASGLSYADPGSCAKKEPLHATPYMACSGGGWIVPGLVMKDRSRV